MSNEETHNSKHSAQNLINSNLFDYDFKDAKIVLVFGNEVSGVNPEILKIADAILKLPMAGAKNSLNVAVTVSAVLYLIKYRTLKESKIQNTELS